MMAATVSIREARPPDLAAIAGLWEELMAFHEHLDRHFAPSPGARARFQAFASEHLRSNRACMPVAQYGTALVGYCIAVLAAYPPVFAQREYGLILDLAVTREWRRSGTGRRLYQHAEAWFADRGIHRINVRVVLSNEGSCAFWQAMGFESWTATLAKQI